MPGEPATVSRHATIRIDAIRGVRLIVLMKWIKQELADSLVIEFSHLLRLDSWVHTRAALQT